MGTKHLLFSALLTLGVSGFTQQATAQSTSSPIASRYHLLPTPKQAQLGTSPAFVKTAGAQLHVAGLSNLAILNLLCHEQGLSAPTYNASESAADVTFRQVSQIAGAHNTPLFGYGNEAYRLTITSHRINIDFVDSVGAIRAVQTLAQLAQAGGANGLSLPQSEITDWPAFKVRGYMHDVGRSFISVNELKRQIDMFARFKVNTFHWHFTENQAWRLEVKAYPQLTQSSNMTRFAGQYYTQAQVKEVLQYAKERGVIVIPEIDMPGHSDAYRRAMGHDMQSDAGVAALKAILSEIVPLFADAPYLHIGADEKDITYRATENGKERNFVQIMVDHVHKLGKKVVIWNPIHSVSIAESGADMTQMWSTRGRHVSGIPSIDCRYNYTNHFDVFADLVGIYKSNIYYQSQSSADVAGAITAPWNDRKLPTETAIIKQNNHYAVTIATAERAWKGGGRQYIEEGGTTLPNVGAEYDEFADFEARFLHHKNTTLAAVKDQIPYVKQSHMRWQITDAFPNEGDTARVFPPETVMTASTLQPTSYEYRGKTYGTNTATGAGIYLRHTWGNGIMPTFYGTKTDMGFNHTAYAWTYVYSEQARTVNALIEFQNYGRSENDPAPPAGRWDYKGSKIWLNGTLIPAPRWKNAGRSINSEIDLQDENFTARQPIALQLQAGWNKIFIKLPFVDTPCRLEKWMFTCALTDPATGETAEGLTYSPTQIQNAAAETLSLAVSDAERKMAQLLSHEVGFYPTSLGTEVSHKIAELKTAIANTALTAEQSQTEMATLSRLVEQMVEATKTAHIVQPETNDGSGTAWYSLQTPKRSGLYTTSRGAGQKLMGSSTLSFPNSVWRFVRRADGTFNIVNADGSYLSPESSNNTALLSTLNPPSKGWTLEAASEVGYVIVKSGNVQMNQTHFDDIFNWGNGTNKDDTGCMFTVRLLSPTAAADALAALKTQAEQSLANATNVGRVGFRTQSAKEALTALLQQTDATYQQLLSALQQFENSMQMPVDGKVYVLRNVQQNGKFFYLTDNNGDLTTTPTSSAAPNLANAFVCKTLPNGKYVFVNAKTGNYLIWKNHNASAALNNNKGTVANTAYTENACAWTMGAGKSSVEGTFYLAAKRANGSDGTLQIMGSGAFDAWSNSLAYHPNYSNLWFLDDFEGYPNVVNLQALGNEAAIASVYLPFAAQLPQGLTAYSAQLQNDKLRLTQVAQNGILPANTAVVLRGEKAGEATLVPATSNGTPIASNELTGTIANAPTPTATTYVLGEKDGEAAFVPLVSGSYPLGRAVFHAPASPLSAYPLAGLTTGLRELMEHSGNTLYYDLSGRPAPHAQGILIQKGRKLLRK